MPVDDPVVVTEDELRGPWGEPPPGLADLLNRCFAVNPISRPDIDEVVHLLEGILANIRCYSARPSMASTTHFGTPHSNLDDGFMSPRSGLHADTCSSTQLIQEQEVLESPRDTEFATPRVRPTVSLATDDHELFTPRSR